MGVCFLYRRESRSSTDNFHRALSFVVAIVYVASLQIRLDVKSIVLSLVFCFVLIACVWTIMQISSWAALAHNLTEAVQSWLKPSNISEDERLPVTRHIIRARRNVKRKTTALVRPVLVKAASLPSLPKAVRKVTGQLRRKTTQESSIC